MKFEDMRKLTQRFDQIIGASQIKKNERLEVLKNDIIEAFPNDPFANQFISTIEEVMT